MTTTTDRLYGEPIKAFALNGETIYYSNPNRDSQTGKPLLPQWESLAIAAVAQVRVTGLGGNDVIDLSGIVDGSSCDPGRRGQKPDQLPK